MRELNPRTEKQATKQATKEVSARHAPVRGSGLGRCDDRHLLKDARYWPGALKRCSMLRAVALVAVGLGGALGGCRPTADPANFPKTPGALRAGRLLGPYDGVLLDGDTERPIEGATVAGVWTFESGAGAGGPEGSASHVVKTTADGRYRIPELEVPRRLRPLRVRRFTLIAYHPGHVGWRSDHVFPSGQVRADFSQSGNIVRMADWQAGVMDHGAHLGFLGGPSEIREAAGWESKEAMAEALSARLPSSRDTVSDAASGVTDAGPWAAKARPGGEPCWMLRRCCRRRKSGGHRVRWGLRCRQVAGPSDNRVLRQPAL